MQHTFIFFSLILTQICLAEGVKYIVSPYESDAQIAHLLSSGEADFALTEDSDLLVFGCKKVRNAIAITGVGFAIFIL